MDNEGEKIFNAQLFTNLSYNYEINNETEFETSNDKDINHDNFNFNDYKSIEAFINPLFEGDDFMKNDNHDNKEYVAYQSKEKSSFNNTKDKTNNNKKKKINKLKNYNIRKGDWLCNFCNNINFSFRIKCNLCGRDK